MPLSHGAIAAMRESWAQVEARFSAYGLILPGDASFICQAALCNAHCCRAFSVPLGDREVARLAGSSGRQPVHFLESEDGAPVRLPLAQPYLLARSHGHCALLGRDLACGEYEGRPDACRRYPHEVIFIDVTSGRPAHASGGVMREAVEALIVGEVAGAFQPLLLRHLECPGFTGPALGEEAWAAQLRETFGLQLGG